MLGAELLQLPANMHDSLVEVDVLECEARDLANSETASGHQHRHEPQRVRVGIDHRPHPLIGPRLDPRAVPGPGLADDR